MHTSKTIDFPKEFAEIVAEQGEEPGLLGFWRLMGIFARFDDGDESEATSILVDTLLRVGGKTDDDPHYLRRRFAHHEHDVWLLIGGIPTMRAILASGSAAALEHKGMAAAGALVCALTAPGSRGLELVSRIALGVVRRLSRSRDSYIRRKLKEETAQKMLVGAILDRWASRRRPALAFVPQPTKDFARALSRAGAYVERYVERVARNVLFETDISRASHFRYAAAARAAGEVLTPAFIDVHKSKLHAKQRHENGDGLRPIAAWASDIGTTRVTLTKAIGLAVSAGAIEQPRPFQGAKLLSQGDVETAMSFVKRRRRAATNVEQIALALALEPEEVTRTVARLVKSGDIASGALATKEDLRAVVEELGERHPAIRSVGIGGQHVQSELPDAEHAWTLRRDL